MSDEDVSMIDATPRGSTVLAWDRQKCVPLDRCLSKDDLVLLLTPVVVPGHHETAEGCDPFEPLGKGLAERHPVVRHVPYTKQGGITGVHVAFIKKADVVVFVVTGQSEKEETSQLDLAEAASEACDSRPLIVVVCCTIPDAVLQQYDFSTVVRSPGFKLPDLAAISTLLLYGAENPSLRTAPSTQVDRPFQSWRVERCNDERVLEEIYALWIKTVPAQFHLDKPVFRSILFRDGYSLHYIVRDPSKGNVVGWCATYTTFADSKEEQLVGSIASVIVDECFQNRGVGSALHEEALSQLRKIRGVHRVQLGTTFPRLLYGLPTDHASEKWFQTRGWMFDQVTPGNGRLMADWLLWFSEAPSVNLASAGLSFRPCEITDVPEVLQFVGRESERKHGFGWYDQYTTMLDGDYMGEVILGFEGTTMVASAITYMPNCGNPTASDLPWAATVGGDVGGITCICIKGRSIWAPELTPSLTLAR